MKRIISLFTAAACLVILTGMAMSDQTNGNAERSDTEDRSIVNGWDFENPDYWLTPDDEETCGEDTGKERHWGLFHSIPNTLMEFVASKDSDFYNTTYNSYHEKFGWRDDHNIVNFILFTGVTPEEFVAHVSSSSLDQYVNPAGGPGFYLDVIYSGDWELIQEFYTRPANPDTGR